MHKDLDRITDPKPHDAYTKGLSNFALLETYWSRKRRGKPTWQMEREMRSRGLGKHML